MNYLTMEEVKLIIRQPDTSVPNGRRDLTMLSLMYDTGARVQEIADLKVRDIRFDNLSSIRLFGKGRKAREVPLMRETTALLKSYAEGQKLMTNDKLDHPLFYNDKRNHFTRAGISYILKKYVQGAKEINPQLSDSISPML